MSAEFNPRQPNGEEGLAKKNESQAASVMRRLFEGLRRPDQDKSEEDGSTETSKKFKRIRKGFSKLFGSKIVERPDGTSGSKDQERGLGLGALLSLERPSIDVGTDSGPSELRSDLPEHSVDAKHTTSMTRAESNISAETPDISVDQTRPTRPQSQRHRPSTPPSLSVPTAGDVAPVPPPLPSNPNVYPAPSDLNLSPDMPVQSPEISVNPNNISDPASIRSVERETIIERRGSLALPLLLTGAEYLARKADTKDIRRRQTEVNREVRVNLERTELKNQRASERLRTHQEDLTKVRAELQDTKSRLEVLRQQQDHEPRVRTQPEQSRPNAQEVYKRPNFERYVPEKPKEVLENIAAAAEQNIAVERVLERSHEVKDDESSHASTAQSVGAVLAAQRATQQQAQADSSTKVHTVQQGPLPMAPPDYGHPSYRSAMKWGFGVAVTIVVFALIAYLM